VQLSLSYLLLGALETTNRPPRLGRKVCCDCSSWERTTRASSWLHFSFPKAVVRWQAAKFELGQQS